MDPVIHAFQDMVSDSGVGTESLEVPVSDSVIPTRRVFVGLGDGGHEFSLRDGDSSVVGYSKEVGRDDAMLVFVQESLVGVGELYHMLGSGGWVGW